MFTEWTDLFHCVWKRLICFNVYGHDRPIVVRIIRTGMFHCAVKKGKCFSVYENESVPLFTERRLYFGVSPELLCFTDCGKDCSVSVSVARISLFHCVRR